MKLFVRFLTVSMLAIYSSVCVAAVTVTVNGSNHTIPQTNEKGWGANVTAWIQAISANTLQPSGGNFTLTADANFGANFGLLSNYYKSRSSNISTAGVFRLSNTDTIGFRNAANSGNLLLGVDSSDRLTYNGSPFLPSAALTASRALATDAGGIVSVTAVTSSELGYVSGVTSSIQDQIDTKALDSDLTTHISDTSTHGVTGDIVGTSDSQTLTNKTLTSPIISTISNTGTLTLPTSTDTLVGRDTTDTLTNKTATNIVLNGTLSGTAIIDEDDMASDSATKVPTQQSVKAYVDTNAGGFGAIQTKTAAYTALTSDGLILCSSSAFTITLYTAVGNTGRQITIKKTDSSFSNVITIDGNASETIEGNTTTTLNTLGETLRLVSDGSNWQILQRMIPSAWVADTPTFTGLGSMGTVAMERRRNGPNLEFRGHFTAGTPTAVNAQMSLPSGLTVDGSASSTVVGTVAAGSTTNPSAKLLSVLAFDTNTEVFFGFFRDDSTASPLSVQTGSNALLASTRYSINGVLSIPITGWN